MCTVGVGGAGVNFGAHLSLQTSAPESRFQVGWWCRFRVGWNWMQCKGVAEAMPCHLLKLVLLLGLALGQNGLAPPPPCTARQVQ